jgi:hypothetical protein
MTWAGKAAALTLVLLLAGLSLRCRARSEQEVVAGVLDDLAQQVEQKDASGLATLLADDYADFEGRDREQTRVMAEEYFTRYRGIKTKLLSSRVVLGGPETASAEADVSLYSGVGAALRKAVGFSGENYRVLLALRKQGRWRVSEARWEYIPESGLFPESLKVLQELFPER